MGILSSSSPHPHAVVVVSCHVISSCVHGLPIKWCDMHVDSFVCYPIIIILMEALKYVSTYVSMYLLYVLPCQRINQHW